MVTPFLGHLYCPKGALPLPLLILPVCLSCAGAHGDDPTLTWESRLSEGQLTNAMGCPLTGSWSSSPQAATSAHDQPYPSGGNHALAPNLGVAWAPQHTHTCWPSSSLPLLPSHNFACFLPSPGLLPHLSLPSSLFPSHFPCLPHRTMDFAA